MNNVVTVSAFADGDNQRQFVCVQRSSAKFGVWVSSIPLTTIPKPRSLHVAVVVEDCVHHHLFVVITNSVKPRFVHQVQAQHASRTTIDEIANADQAIDLWIEVQSFGQNVLEFVKATVNVAYDKIPTFSVGR